MGTQNPLRSKTNLSLFIGLWLGLTATAGVVAFVALFWAAGGFDREAASPTPLAVATPAATALPTAPPPTPQDIGGGGAACNFRPAPASGFGYGIQSHVFVGENADWMAVIADKLHFDWVKMQVRWSDLELAPGEMLWGLLDNAINAACDKGLRVMLSVVDAPAWTQANPMPAPEGQAAPPDDYQLYADLLGKIVDRYPGRVAAIEVWNEMNLEREWNTAAGVSAADYAKLLQIAYATVKAKDPNIVIISGAPSPTGINCRGAFPACQPTGRPIVVDDVTYLREFIAAGGLAYADCVGTHSNGTNLPPTSDGANPPDRTGYTFFGAWDNPHYSWALKSQVETYAALPLGQKQQCVTEFGYASVVNGQYPPNFGFAADVTEKQQGEYIIQAFNWMRDSGLVKMAFLFNLDYGPKGGDPATDDNVIFSILTREGIPRPAFDALSLMEKP